MQVKCVSLVPAIGSAGIKPINGTITDESITLGRHYIVYAIEVVNGRVLYWIECDLGVAWPEPFDSTLFEVVSGELSSEWRLASLTHLFIGPSVWVNGEQGGHHFGDRLTDGEPEAVAKFNAVKDVMELEFVDDRSSVTARVVDGKWLQCPHCDEVWESSSPYGQVRCPTCRKVSRNPGYRPKGSHL